jgi:hypothetical protein
VTIQFAYVPYAHILEFLEVEQGDTSTPVEWNVYKNFPVKQMSSNQLSKTTLGIRGKNLWH